VKAVAEKLKKVECDPKCGFLVQSHDEKEIVDIAVQHAQKSHNMKITEKDVKEMMTDAA
jgi:predicted small metal-binding protein